MCSSTSSLDFIEILNVFHLKYLVKHLNKLIDKLSILYRRKIILTVPWIIFLIYLERYSNAKYRN